MKKTLIGIGGILSLLCLGSFNPISAQISFSQENLTSETSISSPENLIAQSVSPQDLERFADTWLTVRNINLLSLELTSRILRSEGIARERSVAIVEGMSNIDELNPPLSDTERQTFEKVAPLIRGVYRFRQLAVNDEITKAGFTVDRYEQVRNSIGENENLQQQFQQRLEQILQQREREAQ